MGPVPARPPKGREESEVDEGRARHEPNRGHGTAASRTRRSLTHYVAEGVASEARRQARDERNEMRDRRLASEPLRSVLTSPHVPSSLVILPRSSSRP